MPLPKLVIFDLDNTLVATEAVTIPDAVRQLRDEFGVKDIQLEDWYKDGGYHGLAGQHLLDRVAQDFGIPVNLQDFTAARTRSLGSLFEREGVALAKNVGQALNFLDTHNIQHCIASNSHPARIENTLKFTKDTENTNFSKRFADNFYSAQSPEINNEKPAPDVYLAALKAFNCAPQDAIAVEDSATGVKAAFAAGIPTLGYVGLDHAPQETTEKLYQAGSTTVFEDWVEFEKLITE